ncbi:hypothetical protein DFH06DRAFT_1040920, partial [Mycena polygramma]
MLAGPARRLILPPPPRMQSVLPHARRSSGMPPCPHRPARDGQHRALFSGFFRILLSLSLGQLYHTCRTLVVQLCITYSPSSNCFQRTRLAWTFIKFF